MAIGDGFAKAFPMASRAAGFGARDVGVSASASGPNMQNLRTSIQHMQCDLSTMVGPFACMHDEHLTIIENQKIINDKLDEVLKYLTAHFQAPQ